MSNAYHGVDGFSVPLLLFRGGVDFLGAFLKHVPHFHCILVAVVQDTSGHFPIPAGSTCLLQLPKKIIQAGGNHPPKPNDCEASLIDRNR